MSHPPPLAPVPPLTSNNSKKRNASQTGLSNNLTGQPLNKKYKPNAQYQYYHNPHHNAHHNPHHNPHQQYYTQSYQTPPNYDLRQSTKQYYDNPKRTKKSPTPQIIQAETVCISNNNNTFPDRILDKLQDRKIMFDIGTCSGLLFGQIEMQKEAIPGNINITYRKQERNNQPIISVSNNDNNIYLGQGDTKLVKLFADFMNKKELQLTGKIIEANLDMYKKRLPPNRFVRKLLINVSCEYDIILSVISRSKKKVKNWKWISKSICLKYFEGLSIEYNELFDFILESINDNAINGRTNILSLEANFNATFATDITAEDLDGIDPYEEIVSTKLLQHQRIGLEWMIIRENGLDNDEEDIDDAIPPFYKEIEDKETGDIKYINLLNDEECDDLPELGCGGILADDMGLGKTLQCISLIASNSNYQNDSENGAGPTLIVAPLTVIGNWISQITDHCQKNSFRIMIYHGPNREKDLNIIKSYNIVITTYDIVALEFCDENDENREEMRKHYGCGLQYVNWLRVVLDEAHKIRSRKTRVFKACNALVSKSRWCLTGTPVQNRLDDLYSLFCFLKLQPICDKNFWHKFIIGPLKNSNPIGFERLRKIMKQLCLRRDKSMKINGKPIISIPDKIVKTRILTFISEEKDKYLQLMAIHKAAFNRMRQRGDKEIMRNFSSVLSMLLRLRQCCAHTLLVPQLNNNNQNSMDIDSIDISSNNMMNDISGECSSCGMVPDIAILTNCKHIYCKDCFLYELEINNGIFPCTLCGDKLTNKSILREIKDKHDDDNNDNNNDNNEEKKEEDDINNNKKKKKKYKKFTIPIGIKVEPSTKMRALIEDVKSWNGCEVGGLPNKAVVFSQWTSVLDILARCLDNEEILYERLDGSMSRSTREAAMDNFRQQPDIPVFLMSLKAGNLGVNMTVANHVYMLDPWWNPATEDQAVDRVYRLGQKRIVHVNHFVIKDSVEEKILKIQSRKRKLIQSALGQSKEDLKQERKNAWLNDLKDLFTAK